MLIATICKQHLHAIQITRIFSLPFNLNPQTPVSLYRYLQTRSSDFFSGTAVVLADGRFLGDSAVAAEGRFRGPEVGVSSGASSPSTESTPPPTRPLGRFMTCVSVFFPFTFGEAFPPGFALGNVFFGLALGTVFGNGFGALGPFSGNAGFAGDSSERFVTSAKMDISYS